ncbi:hypothetical protein OS493_026679 [Desmophyllum pertusum]|uniref:Uncharacterized protein n=1 Tax=Desmophyllum pertusum TaxID=174260 RepID=A0A9W9ZYD7_9CNID|nr:hypothetical protein OS493_026679 [Desmophyllum pertusum]
MEFSITWLHIDTGLLTCSNQEWYMSTRDEVGSDFKDAEYQTWNQVSNPPSSSMGAPKYIRCRAMSDDTRTPECAAEGFYQQPFSSVITEKHENIPDTETGYDGGFREPDVAPMGSVFEEVTESLQDLKEHMISAIVRDMLYRDSGC